MTPDQIDLARRLVACPRWRWMPGMLAIEWPAPGMGLARRPMRVDDGWPDVGVYLPDLTDPATAGCLLEMLGRPTTLPAPWVSDWHAGVPLGEAVARALLVVWEAAP